MVESGKNSKNSFRLVRNLAMFLAIALVVVGIPYVYELLWREPFHGQTWYSRLIMSAMKGTTVFYSAFIGASIGSFINVVAYRMPLGLSVVSAPSACPRCKSKIHGTDNVPVFGWLMLGGRCRKCDLSISSRYPLVELWFGLFFFILLMFELITAAANLPGGPIGTRQGVSEIIWYTKWNLVAIYLFHCFLVGTLSTWSLFKLDRNRIPGFALVFPFVVGGAVALFWGPSIPVVPTSMIEPSTGMVFWAAPVFGLMVGALMGGVVELMVMKVGFNVAPQKGLIAGVALTGMMLGWQAALSTCLIFSFLFFFSRFVADAILLARGPILGIWTLATLIQICLWEPLSRLPFWPGGPHEFSDLPAIVGVVGTTAMLLAARYLLPFEQEIEPFESEGYGEFSEAFAEQNSEAEDDDQAVTEPASSSLDRPDYETDPSDEPDDGLPPDVEALEP